MLIACWYGAIVSLKMFWLYAMFVSLLLILSGMFFSSDWGWLLDSWTYIIGFHVWFVGSVRKVKDNVKEVNDFLVCFSGDFKVV